MKEKVAVVTGGAARLGQACALALAEQGCRLAIHYNSSAAAAAQTVAQINQLGAEAIAVQADLRYTAQVRAVIDRVVAHFGRVDVLINNAAIFESGDIASTTEENWERHFAINLRAPFFLSQAFFKASSCRAEQPGQIINITDWRAERPGASYLAYTLTKAGLLNMTKSLALALAPTIRVNCIALGAVLPPRDRDQAYLAQLAKAIPTRRPGTLDDVTRTLCFLLQSDFITGDVVFLTGGQHL